MYITVLQVVKQTVMTSVYGVTFVGARKQIQNVLEERVITGTGVSPLCLLEVVLVLCCFVYLF